MSEIKKIGLITSGGDCGGLNAVIKGVSAMANYYNLENVVIPNGYAGLYNLIDFGTDELISLDYIRTGLFHSNIAGSEAGHSRVKISKLKDENKYNRIKQGLDKHSIDALVVSGGDDTGSVALDLVNKGIAVNHVPKTMDLDLQSYSVGGDSTINAISKMAANLRTTARSHNRIMILEVFGRYAGHAAFRGGIAADADCIIIPEVAPDFDIIYEDMFANYTERIKKSDVKAGSYLIVVSEALKGNKPEDEVDERGFLIDKTRGVDAFGHYPLAGSGKTIEAELKKRMKNDEKMKEFMEQVHMYVQGQYEIPEIRVIRPTHLVRCGDSSGYDANFGKECGAGAVILLMQNVTGATVTGVRNGVVEYMNISEAIKQNTVNLDQVALHEALGICFGRKSPKTVFGKKMKLDTVNRYL
ncbi:6-phosphofructokinase 1 [Candidatus Methanophagaceae archaeon]|nr:6-phosphofructokinase 1 [Methanophagales archaeon]